MSAADPLSPDFVISQHRRYQKWFGCFFQSQISVCLPSHCTSMGFTGTAD